MRHLQDYLQFYVGLIIGAITAVLIFSQSNWKISRSQENNVSTESKQVASVSPKPVEPHPVVEVSKAIETSELPKSVKETTQKGKKVFVDESPADKNGIYPAPHWHPESAVVLKPDADGNVYFRWIGIAGVRNYTIRLEDQNGKVVKVLKSVRSFMFNDDNPLPPGQSFGTLYATVYAVNSHNQEGPASLKKKIVLGDATAPVTRHPAKTSTRKSMVAPEIEEIKVEQ